MTTELWGGAAGEQMAITSQGSLAQANLARAQVPLMTAEAGLKQNELSMQNRFMQGMQQINQSSAVQQDMPTQLNKMATLAMNSGMVDRAASLSDKAAEINSRMAQMAHNKMLVQNEQVQQGKNTLNLMGQFLSGATDQQSWDRGNTLFTMMTGRQSPYAGMPYNPKFVDELQSQAMTAKEHADLMLHADNTASLEQQRLKSQEFIDFRMNMMERAQALREGHESRLTKSGGKIVGAPSKDEQAESMRMISTEYPNLPSEEVGNMSYGLAARAKAIRTANPGIDAESAMGQALQEMKITNPPGMLEKAYRVAEVVLGKGDVSSPMTLPQDRSKLVVGKYYKGKTGVGQYQKDGSFKMLPAGDEIPAAKDSRDDLNDESAAYGGY
jgi:hypothetical protein